MHYIRLALLFCAFVTSSSRSLSTEGGNPENATFPIDQVNIDMNFDSVELSEFLRCSACLTECVRVRETLSYFLCKTCLASCANKTDVFMHFFSSHQCDVNPSDSKDSTSTATAKPLARPKSASGTEALDQYMEREYFSDNCNEAKYQDMARSLSICKTNLGNCNSKWHSSPLDAIDYAESSPDALDYPESSPDDSEETIDYPEEKPESPDEEKSADPPTTSKTTTFEALERLGFTSPEITRLMHLSNGTEFDSDVDFRNFTEEEVANIVKKFKSMFVTKQQFKELLSFEWGDENTLALLKSASPHASEEQRTAACPIRYKVRAPTKAVHRSGQFSVQVLQSDENKQPFIYAECSFKKPIMGSLSNAECRTLTVQRSAVIIVDEKKLKTQPLDNCVPHDDDKYICREWINVAGACALFL